MKFDNMFQVISENELIPDGMGGWIESDKEISIGTLNCFIAPVTAEIMMKDYGLVSTTAIKIYTKDHLPTNKHYYLRHLYYDELNDEANNDKRYKILQISDYGKYRMILAERF